MRNKKVGASFVQGVSCVCTYANILSFNVGSQQGSENSRMYNEMVIIKMVQSSTKLLQQPPELFRREVCEHWIQRGFEMHERIKGWMELSKLAANNLKDEATTKGASQKELHEPKQSNMTAGKQTFVVRLN